jgi:hypothetical protein
MGVTMGTASEPLRLPDELPDHYVVVGKSCVVVQNSEARRASFTGRAWGGWRVDVELAEGPVEVRVGTLDGARLLSGNVVWDHLGPVLQDLRVVAVRQDRAEVRVSRLGEFWVSAPDSNDWVLAEVRDLSASGAALIVADPLPVVRLRGSVRTEHGHEVEFETEARLVRLAEGSDDEDGVVAVYDLDLDDTHRCALRAAVLWETSAKRGNSARRG